MEALAQPGPSLCKPECSGSRCQRTDRCFRRVPFQDGEWAEGAKECGCSCHEGGGDPRLKRSKRRSCSHCSNKVGVGQEKPTLDRVRFKTCKA